VTDVEPAAGVETAAEADEEAALALSDTRLGSVVGVARREYRILARSRATAGLVVLFAAFSTAVVGFGGSAVGPGRTAAVVATLTELSVYLVPLAALAFGYDAVVGARERGTFDALLVLPLSRTDVVVGTFLGRAVALASGLTVGLAAGGVLLAYWAGLAALGQYLAYVALSVAVGLASLAVSLVPSTAFAEKTRALGATLLAWVWFVLVYDLLAIAAVVALGLDETAVAGLLVANPVDVYRVAVLATLPTADAAGNALAAAGLPLPVAVAALLAWTVVPVALATRLVRR
jgi:Cu-processing system permease protein